MKRTFFASLAFLCFFGFLGTVGSIEQATMELGKGLLWMTLYLFGLAVAACAAQR